MFWFELNPKKLLLTRFSLRNVRARMFPEEMLAPVARSTPAFNRPREHERGFIAQLRQD